MTTQEQALILFAGLDLASTEKPIDLGQIREKIERILTDLGRKMPDLAKKYKHGSEFGIKNERDSASREVDMFMKKEIGVTAPSQVQLAPGDPLLLIWSYTFGTTGNEFTPILIELGRVVKVNPGGHQDLEIDVISLAEIPMDNPILVRVDPKEPGVRRRVLYPNNDVIVPLKY